MRSVIPWSWSSLSAYETCPRAFYEIKIAKNYVEDFNKDYILWGNDVHKALELRVGYNTPLPARMQSFEKLAASLYALPGKKYVELETGISTEFGPAEYWGDNCWHRGKDDITIVNGYKALNGDYKTGKENKDTQQLELAAVRTMINFPEVEEVTTAYFWLQTGKVVKYKYVRANIAPIIERFVERVGNMLWSEQNNTWPARPSGLCKKSRRPGSTYAGCIVASCPHSEFYKGNK